MGKGGETAKRLRQADRERGRFKSGVQMTDK
jgi:hypothetical protein